MFLKDLAYAVAIAGSVALVFGGLAAGLVFLWQAIT
jgi:hypothetical protein